MSPLRPANTSTSRSASSRSVISPIGVMLCGLATLITVPVVLSSGASSDGQEVAAVVVPETISASDLDADVDIGALFDAGADLEHVPDMELDERGAQVAAEAVVAAPQSLSTSAGVVSGDEAAEEAATAELAEAASVEAPAAPSTTQAPITSTTISAAPVTVAPAPTTTAPPVTEAPAPTQAPVTEAPTTTAAPVAEAPQSVEQPAEPVAEAAPAQPTPEQWAALRHCEASGNYSIVSRNGLYHGAYQFYQPTWDGLANQLGRTDLVGLAPSQAAAADQDALALLLWQQRGNQPWPHCGVHLPAGP